MTRAAAVVGLPSTPSAGVNRADRRQTRAAWPNPSSAGVSRSTLTRDADPLGCTTTRRVTTPWSARLLAGK